jgi:hypothetical protein
MHRTLKAETTRPPEANFPDQQGRFDEFQAEYNEIRPHQALDGQVPASRYARSNRKMTGRCTEPDYPGHFEVRKVGHGGSAKLNGQKLFISKVLYGEHVGFEEVDEGIWSLFFDRVLLGRFDERAGRLHHGHP